MKSNKFIKTILGLATIAPSAYLIVSCGCNNSNGDITILYTNDTHCALENSTTKLGFVNVAGYRDSLEAKGTKTLLVDSGDFIQGSSYGTIGQGKYLVDMFNACKYDLVVPGNHEFDFGMDRFNQVRKDLNVPMISTNFYHVDTKSQLPTTKVLDDTKIFTINNKKIGFVGVTTPSCITSSNPKSFQDKDGNYIFSFLGYSDPVMFYYTVQQSLNYLKDNKCDYIIGLAHLGIYDSDTPYDTKKLIQHTSGFDFIFDGHTHTVMEPQKIKDSNGKEVQVSQTGTQFNSFGALTIKSNNQIENKLITECDLKSDDVLKTSNKIKSEVKEILDVEIGSIDFTLRIDDGADEPKRVVRRQECNMGDFFADGLAFGSGGNSVENAPIAVVNGGAIRKNITQGKVTYGSIMDVAPFGNNICIIEVTGQVILDMLEYAVHCAEEKEFGSFLQISSRLHYEADLTIPTPCVVEQEKFISIDPSKPRRVSNATIDGVAIDPTKNYKLGGSAYVLRNEGNGYTMLHGAKALECPESIDYDSLTQYFKYCYENNKLGQYREVGNRIILKK